MGIWEVEPGAAVLLLGLAVLAALLPWCHRLYRRHGGLAGWPALVLGATALYLWVVVAITQLPLPATTAQFCRPGRSDRTGWEPRPFSSLVELADAASMVGGVDLLTSSDLRQVVLNVVLFLPLGALLGSQTRLALWAVAVIGLGASAAIELTQGTGLWGVFECPYRLAELSDVLTNGAGAALGWGVGRWGQGWLPQATSGAAPYARATAGEAAGPPPPLGPPSLGRRFLAVAADLVLLLVVGVLAQLVLLGPLLVLEGRGVLARSWFPALRVLVGAVLPGAGLFLLVPLRRPDRATLGQVTALLAPSGDGAPGVGALARRALIRWVPLVALIAAGAGAGGWAVALLAVTLADGVTTLWRGDHRSLAGLASGTTTVSAGGCPATPGDARSGAPAGRRPR
ncbi:MAG: hypothetical protein GEV08_09135 [Acidimicrobiia bacterium]|nr:hypothetical protein [Acidimicrobiia bacterium]